MKKLILFLSIFCGSGLTMVSIYNTVVDAKSWGSDIPASIQAARDYFQHVDPRRFYEVAGPVNLVLIVLTLILFWKESVSLRFYFAASRASRKHEARRQIGAPKGRRQFATDPGGGAGALLQPWFPQRDHG